ncbi:50S ribosomal protein L5 [Sulfidibacter corallicola]|uniref:Large ribosomal subunit protein uL5 n=1 Tax=Sulfidibacter corallicola TaxID=2818388 RepID=A0A8A4TF78_SULCO|nr:50S ribosomal protein L5 [Sulfidibacter corallicola]QTD47864.1 50S ribosomal protein L5 [Sulfidibacter corallicola]
MDRIEKRYRETIRPKLKEELDLKNVMQVPKLEKIVINMGVGEAIGNNKALDAAVEQLTALSGQRAVVTRAKKSISNFKLREGMAIGCRVTLRGEKMYQFFDRLVNIALPRVRDFRGVSNKAFDGRGNYTLGLKDQLIFPEIDYGSIDKSRGMNVCLVTTAVNDEHARTLLTELGFPFRKN